MFSQKIFTYTSGKWDSYILRNGTFKPKVEKIKKIRTEKNCYISGNEEMELSCPPPKKTTTTTTNKQKLDKTFLNFLALKNLIKLFYIRS